MARLACLVLLVLLCAYPATAAERLRVIIETDAGGDPDDEQSLVRFLLYACEWDVEGIICNRAEARPGENLNPERTGLAIVQRMIRAYGECHPKLVEHDPRYPTADALLSRTVAGYADTNDGVQLILDAIDRDDPRPIWFCDWGTEPISASNLHRALNQVRAQRDDAGYAAFKDRLRIIGHFDHGDENFLGAHASSIEPRFKLWVDTFSPEVDGRRWYHRFSDLTAEAGGFRIRDDLLVGHGPLAAMYPTNTTHRQKEGDSGTFLYLMPTGMNNPDQPGWGSWAGRYGLSPESEWQPFYSAHLSDRWQDNNHRDNTLRRWAADLQNDFKARLDWCVHDFAGANHPPRAVVVGDLEQTVTSGETITLDASASSDPDQQDLHFNWQFYPEVGSYAGELPSIDAADTAVARWIAPTVQQRATIHLILTVSDQGSPPLSRYRRMIFTVQP